MFRVPHDTLTEPSRRRFSFERLEERFAPVACTINLGFLNIQMDGIPDDVTLKLKDVYIVTENGPVALGNLKIDLDDLCQCDDDGRYGGDDDDGRYGRDDNDDGDRRGGRADDDDRGRPHRKHDIEDVTIKMKGVYIVPGATINIAMSGAIEDVKVTFDNVHVLLPNASINIGLIGPLDNVNLTLKDIYIVGF